MDVAYIYPPLFKPFYPMATRMITENLLRNKRLNVKFSEIPVKTYPTRIQDRIYDDIMRNADSQFSPSALAFMRQNYIVNNLFYVFMAHGYYDNYIYEDFDQEHIIVTCINFSDLIIVKDLLEKKKKVLSRPCFIKK